MTDRDFKAHVIQLCDDIEDGWLNSKTIDLTVIHNKAKQLRRYAFDSEDK